MVRDEPHGVDLLRRCARRHEDFLPRKIFLRTDRLHDPVKQRFFGRHLARAYITASQIPAVRLDHRVPEASQFCKIILHNGVQEHIRVHRRRNQNRAAARHHGRRQHVVRNAVRNFADDIRARGGNEHNVRALCQRNVLHAVLEIAVERIDEALVARQSLKCNGVDKIRGVLRHQHRNIRVLLFQHTRKPRNFVRRNAARHAQ